VIGGRARGRHRRRPDPDALLRFPALAPRGAAGPRARPQPRRHPHARGLARLGSRRARRAGGSWGPRSWPAWAALGAGRSRAVARVLPRRSRRRARRRDSSGGAHAAGAVGEAPRPLGDACSLWEAAARAAVFDPRPWESWPSPRAPSAETSSAARALVDDALGLAEARAVSSRVARRSHRRARLNRRSAGAGCAGWRRGRCRMGSRRLPDRAGDRGGTAVSLGVYALVVYQSSGCTRPSEASRPRATRPSAAGFWRAVAPRDSRPRPRPAADHPRECRLRAGAAPPQRRRSSALLSASRSQIYGFVLFLIGRVARSDFYVFVALALVGFVVSSLGSIPG